MVPAACQATFVSVHWNVNRRNCNPCDPESENITCSGSSAGGIFHFPIDISFARFHLNEVSAFV